MSGSMADYLKRYTSGSAENDAAKKKKKKKEKDIKPPTTRMRIMEEDAFVNITSAGKNDNSDDEDELRIVEQLKKQANTALSYRKTFAPIGEGTSETGG
ncbi:unnamed protein product, partial [Mesorhabditis spiculigera]